MSTHRHPLHLAVAVALMLAMGTPHSARSATPAESPASWIGVRQAFQHALQSDAGIDAAGHAREAGSEKAVQGDSLLRPRVGFNAGVNYMDVHTAATLPPQFAAMAQPHTSGTVSQAAIQLTQPLYNPANSAARDQSLNQSALAEISYEGARQDLMMRVADAYLQVLAAREAHELAVGETGVFSEQRERSQARFDYGRGKITEVQESQARLDAARARLIAARSTMQLREARFRSITGLAPDALGHLPDRGATNDTSMRDTSMRDAAQEQAELEELQASGEHANLRVQAKMQEVEIAREEVRKHRLASRATVDLVGSYRIRQKSGDLSLFVAPDRDRAAVVGVQLNVPLYGGGGIDSKEREAIARAGQAESELLALQRDVRLVVQESWVAMNAQAARIKALEQAATSLRSAVDATMLARDVGSRTQVDVMDAQQRLLDARRDLSQARIDHLLARARLLWAAGRLDEQALAMIDGFLVAP